jgi:hypothetical protein
MGKIIFNGEKVPLDIEGRDDYIIPTGSIEGSSIYLDKEAMTKQNPFGISCKICSNSIPFNGGYAFPLCEVCLESIGNLIGVKKHAKKNEKNQ